MFAAISHLGSERFLSPYLFSPRKRKRREGKGREEQRKGTEGRGEERREAEVRREKERNGKD